MSDDLISREGTKQAIRHKFKTLAERCEINEVLNSMPSVQPKKTGKWLHDQGKYENRWICTECSYKWYFPKEEAKYCPNCGAKMESENKKT